MFVCCVSAWHWLITTRSCPAAMDRKTELTPTGCRQSVEQSWQWQQRLCTCVSVYVESTGRDSEKPKGESLLSCSVCPLSHCSQSSLVPSPFFSHSALLSSLPHFIILIIPIIMLLHLIIIPVTSSSFVSCRRFSLSSRPHQIASFTSLYWCLKKKRMIKAKGQIAKARNSCTSVDSLEKGKKCIKYVNRVNF